MTLADRLRAVLPGRYTVEREIDHGGMAVVFLAHDAQYDRPVAVKVLRPELSATLLADRFVREIQIAAQLQHPLIVPLFESGGSDGVLWYVMPFVEGETLRQRLARDHQLSLEDTVRIAQDAAAALQYAHQHGLVHRDVKPENILLSGGKALLADFGIARALTRAAGPGTSSGAAVGTPAYMSPEQAAGNSTIDARSDIYSLGCVVFEMLGGEPPFTGSTPQAVIQRQVSERVPSLRVVRPGVTGAVQAVVERALAKSPADRFATVSEFQAALESAAASATPPRPPWMRWAGVAAALLAMSGLLVWRGRGLAGRLDDSRVVIYPLAQRGEGDAGSLSGEDVATATLTALNFAEHLEVRDGWRLLDDRQREDPRRLAAADVRRLTRQAGARFGVDGWLLVTDSVRGVIQLHDLVADSTSRTAFAFARSAGAWTMGLRAANALIPRLLPTGGPVDLRALSDRNPAAVELFLRGERSYRRAQFNDALESYRAAVAVDSAFALAALSGALTASWNHRDQDALEFVRTALAHQGLLSPRDRGVAQGFEAYLLGQPDAALPHFERALEADSTRPEPWRALGEVYLHLLPETGALDSLAVAAFQEARRLDSTFAPVLYHLTEFALRRGDLAGAGRLMRQFSQTNPDSAELVPLEISLRCVRESPDRVDWRELARRVPQPVVEAGRLLAVAGLRQPRCAEAAWRAILEFDTAAADFSLRWGALSGLQALLTAEGRPDDLRRLLGSDREFGPNRIARLYIVSALAGASVEEEARKGAAELARAFRSGPAGSNSVDLWHLGIWEAARGDARLAAVLADTLARRAQGSGSRRETLMAKALAARLVLATGDTAEAVRQLAALEPDAVRSALAWYPWESLGGERLLLARLYLARGDDARSYRVAAGFDAPAAVSYIMFLPESLELRRRAALRLNDRAAAEEAGRRLAELGRAAAEGT